MKMASARWRALLGVCGLILSMFPAPVLGGGVRTGDLEILDAWSREVADGSTIRRAFFVVRNHGASDDQLIAVSSPVSATAEIHGGKQSAPWHEMAEKDVITRANRDGVPVPAMSETRFDPAGHYVMFVDLNSVTPKGGKFTATLTFRRAGNIDVDFVVDMRPVMAPATQSRQ